ncbi:MAG: NAD(P)-dependent alcohol dehydrogenase [Anaerolineales bacterium]|nr:NAD(P)-dependent alcohol dehydrogenase [Anaerolineales bacterium]MBX3038682.1 NAD(P)-dependent alcohol dehydrogenase [Anaerolineales bacterium]
MKAFVYHEYGTPDVLKLEEIQKPSPKDDEILVKVRAVSLNKADAYFLKGEPFMLRFEAGLQRPQRTILGADISGIVEAVGKNVKQFKIGDEVFADLSSSGLGGLAEYVSAKENAFVHKPTTMSHEEAAAVPMAAVTALQSLKKGNIKAGQKVLINGASGGVGTFALQIAKSFGTEVTAVCSTKHLENARALGADHVIDYTKENFTKNGKQYDLILATNGYHSLADYKRTLTENGVYVCSGGTMKQIFASLLLGSVATMGSQKKITNLTAKPSQNDLMAVKNLIENKKVKSLIDKIYPFEQTPDAFRHLVQGHASGKIVITVL